MVDIESFGRKPGSRICSYHRMEILEPSPDKPITVLLPAELAGQLEKLIQITGRDESAITAAALTDYFDSQAWQIQDIEEGIVEAEFGEFASADEVNSFFAKYGG